MGITDTVERLFPTPDGEGPMVHRTAVVTSVNSDGTLGVTLSGTPMTVNALAGSSAKVGDTVHLAVWAGDLISLGRSRASGGGGAASELIIPTSATVDGGGSSVSVVGGLVTFATATAVHVNGCLLAAFRVHDIIIDFTAHVASVDTQMRLRVAGTDASGATTYGTQRHYHNAAAAGGGNFNSDRWLVDTASGLVSVKNCASVRLIGAAQAVATDGTSDGTNIASTSSMFVFHNGLYHSAATAYDGFTIYVASGTISGTLSVEGHNR